MQDGVERKPCNVIVQTSLETVKEVLYDELTFLPDDDDFPAEGRFGVVRKARWRDRLVAVKTIRLIGKKASLRLP